MRDEDRAAIVALARDFLGGETSAARFSTSARSVCARALGHTGSDETERAALDSLYAVAARYGARAGDPTAYAFATDREVAAAAEAALSVLAPPEEGETTAPAPDGSGAEPSSCAPASLRASQEPTRDRTADKDTGRGPPERARRDHALPASRRGATPAPADAAEAATGSRITIDPAAVARNWRRLARLSRKACGAVVKADAYGLGIGAIAPALARAGCTTFFVALPQEGLALRAILPEATIYVLNGTLGDPRPLVEARLVPFLSSPDALAEWPQDAPFALNVDTGMNRLGLAVPEALRAAETLRAHGVRPALIASHFACADVPSRPENAAQEAAFARARAAFGHVPASFANSAALLTRPASHHELTRPGIALYGGVSAQAVAPLEPAVRLEAKVIQVRTAAAGEGVGYGAAEHLSRPSRLAVASLGYADGYLRAAGGSDASGGAPAFVNGVMTRLVGRASMDLVTVDVTDAPCARGDWIELFGPNVPLEAVARRSGTIGYELLTGLSRRADRRYGPL